MVWIFMKSGFFDSSKALAIYKCDLSLGNPGIAVYFGNADENFFEFDTEEERDLAMAKIKGKLLD